MLTWAPEGCHPGSERKPGQPSAAELGGRGVPAEPLPAAGDGALRAPHPAGPVLLVCAQVLESAREVGPTEVTWLARRAPE